jgi:putative transposase
LAVIGVLRGLTGVQLVISDAHRALTAAIARVMQGSAEKRYRVHATGNLPSEARHEHRRLVAPLVRTVFAQPDHERAPRPRTSSPNSNGSYPRSPDGSTTRRTACSPTPRSHPFAGRRSGRTIIERLNREIKRRTNVVGIFPNVDSVIRLIGALLVEINDMTASDRRNMAANTHQPRQRPDANVTPRITPMTTNRRFLHHVTGHHRRLRSIGEEALKAVGDGLRHSRV